jgi:isoquinoline 1-oxidoreductase beta subunit
MPPRRFPEETAMNYEHMIKRIAAAAPQALAATHREAGVDLNRRTFLKVSVASGFALGVYPVWGQNAPTGGVRPTHQPSAFVSISNDNVVTVKIGKTEIGQGVYTALPMLVAEELDADWRKLRAELAPAGDAYKDPNFGIQMVGGSTSMHNSWQQYREIGARARAMLLAAAAKQWNLPVAELKTSNSTITAPNGKRATYGELAAAAMNEPVPETVTLKRVGDFKIIGKPTGRLDAPAKSTGTQQFGIDLRLPNMRTAVVLHPPVFGAKVARFDAEPAKAIPGVIAVFKVPLDRGATGVAVVADGYWAAWKGREALQVDWDTNGIEKADSATQFAHYKALARQPGLHAREADMARLAAAPKKIVAEYSFPYLAHTPMEPENCTIDFTGDKATVWVGSQFQTLDQAAVAAVLGIKPEQVTLNTMMAGGGFGRRATPTSDYVAEAAQVAKAWRAAGNVGPVKLVWSREDDVKGGYYRPMHVHRVEIGFDDSGKILAWKHAIVGQSILVGSPFEDAYVKNGIDGTMTEGVLDNPYGLPLSLDIHHPRLNVPVLWFRSVGHTHNAYVMETLIDEIARAAGQDPVAYRKRLLGDKHPRHIAALDLAVEKSGYGKKRLSPGRAYGVAVHESFGSVIAYVVEASVTNNQPRLHKVTAAVHCNLPVNPRTLEAQVQGGIIMGLGFTLPGAEITLKDGVVQQNNWGDYRVPGHDLTPQIAVHLVPSVEPPTGFGETPVPALAPAYANAIAALTGKPVRTLPFKLA